MEERGGPQRRRTEEAGWPDRRPAVPGHDQARSPRRPRSDRSGVVLAEGSGSGSLVRALPQVPPHARVDAGEHPPARQRQSGPQDRAEGRGQSGGAHAPPDLSSATPHRPLQEVSSRPQGRCARDPHPAGLAHGLGHAERKHRLRGPVHPEEQPPVGMEAKVGVPAGWPHPRSSMGLHGQHRPSIAYTTQPEGPRRASVPAARFKDHPDLRDRTCQDRQARVRAAAAPPRAPWRSAPAGSPPHQRSASSKEPRSHSGARRRG